MKRSTEELSLLASDMHCVLAYWCRQKECITSYLDNNYNPSESDGGDHEQYGMGAKCLLQQLRWKSELYHSTAEHLFSAMLPLVCSTPAPFESDVCSDSSSSESDSDDDECLL